MAPDTPMPEPPTPLTAKTVVRTDFATTRRGFDPDEVTAHLGRVAEHVADLESTVADLQAQLRDRERAVPQQEARAAAYESTASRIAQLVRTFDQDVERLRSESTAEAEARLAEARANAERIDGETAKLRSDAETEASRIVREARDEAERIRAEADRASEEALSGLQARRAALLENVRRLRDGLARTADSVDGILRGADEVRLDEPEQGPEAGPTELREAPRGPRPVAPYQG